MEITSFALNNFAPEKIFLGGGQICNDRYPSKIPRMSISTALWKRSLTNAMSKLPFVVWYLCNTSVKIVRKKIALKVPLTPNTVSAKMQTWSCSKSDLTFFAASEIFSSNSKTWNLIRFVSWPSWWGAWVYSQFDVTNCFACMFTKSLWHQIRTRARPLLTRSWTNW